MKCLPKSFHYWLTKFIIPCVLIILTTIILTLHFVRPINSVTADIGRHIRNGQLIVKGYRDIWHSNVYSYTHPDYEFINHHWGVGVIFYGIHHYFGFEGLSLFYILLLLATVCFFATAIKVENVLFLRVCLLLLCAPLIADRVEIRPEGFSALFLGVYFWILMRFKQGVLRSRWLVLLPLIQLVWVNVHVFFIGGLVLIGIFSVDAWLNRLQSSRRLYQYGLLSIVATVVNPNGFQGAMVPLNIFKGFGYRLAENQNVFFMMNRFPHQQEYVWYVAAVGIMFILALGMVIRFHRQWKGQIALLLTMLVFLLIGLKAVRCLSIASLFIVAIAPYWMQQIIGNGNKLFRWISIGVMIVLLLESYMGLSTWATPHQRIAKMFPSQFSKNSTALDVLSKPSLWLGTLSGIDRSAHFFRQTGIKGPIFNNYDIGGYLIYHLFPQQRLFVDNRQEAFPQDFFRDVYVPMQEDEQMWLKQDVQYGFNAIYFYRHDLTPWAQPFLIRRLQDPLWAPVFVDSMTIILLKRNEINAPIIRQHELPESLFQVKKNN